MRWFFFLNFILFVYENDVLDLKKKSWQLVHLNFEKKRRYDGWKGDITVHTGPDNCRVSLCLTKIRFTMTASCSIVPCVHRVVMDYIRATETRPHCVSSRPLFLSLTSLRLRRMTSKTHWIECNLHVYLIAFKLVKSLYFYENVFCCLALRFQPAIFCQCPCIDIFHTCAYIYIYIYQSFAMLTHPFGFLYVVLNYTGIKRSTDMKQADCLWRV